MLLHLTSGHGTNQHGANDLIDEKAQFVSVTPEARVLEPSKKRAVKRAVESVEAAAGKHDKKEEAAAAAATEGRSTKRMKKLKNLKSGRSGA